MTTSPDDLDDDEEDEATRQVTVPEADAGERLDRVLAAHLSDLSRTRLKQLVESGRVTMAGATISDPSLRVKPGQSFLVSLPEPVADYPVPQAMDLTIRHEDEHLIVIDKPAGLVVHPAPGNPDHTLVNALLAHCGDSLAGIGGVRRPGIVHRLDKDTSGLMVVAKSALAHASLTADFAARRIIRSYQAVVWGVPLRREGEIDAPIGRSPRDRKKMAVVQRNGKTALTRYRLLRAFGTRAALLECRLATGRTHQIRVHLTEIGHSLIGDPTYGSRSAARLSGLSPAAREAVTTFPRQALHANVIGFRHPASDQDLLFESSIPNDIISLIELLEYF